MEDLEIIYLLTQCYKPPNRDLKEETEDNAGSMVTPQTDSMSKTGVEYGVESNRSDRKETRTVEMTYKLNTIRYRNMI
jgi:hypothetical protein